MTDVHLQLDGILKSLVLATVRAWSLRERTLFKERREHNRSAPTNQLPVEILRKIFEATVGDRSLSIVRPNRPVPQDPRNYATLRLSHVCHHWKEVAEGHSFLWNRIVTADGVSTQLLRYFLRLTRAAPLDVYVWQFCAVNNQILDELTSRCNQL